MSWRFVPHTAPTFTDLQNISLDQQTWGSNIDAASFSLTNLGTSGGTALYTNAGTNVGIGTSSPATQLHVYSSSGQTQVTAESASSSGFALFRVKNDVGKAYQLAVAGSAGGSLANSFYVFNEVSSTTPFLINSSGNVGINTSSPIANCHVHVGTNQNYLVRTSGTISGAVDISAVNDANSSYVQFTINGSSVFLPGSVGIGMSVTPSFWLQLGADSTAKPSTSTWGVVSDARTKTAVKPLEGGTEVINKLSLVEAQYNGLGGTPKDQRVVGVLAQDAQKVIPNCVSCHKGKLNETDTEETDLLSMNFHEVFIHTVLASQQLHQRLCATEAKLEKLHNLLSQA